MTSFRILITGSRTWPYPATIRMALDEAQEQNPYGFKTVVIHGGAAGADVMARDAALSLGYEVEEHLAKWDTHTDRCPDWHWDLPKCKMAGHRRNAEMVDSGADLCLAFIHNDSSGATACAKLADKAQIPTRRYVVNG